MKITKRSLRIFSKFISDFSKIEEGVASNFTKLDKHILLSLKQFNKITKGSSLSFENIKSSYETNQGLHDTFQKFLIYNVFCLLDIFVKESKNDYGFYVQKWNKISKDILNYKNLLLKFQSSRDKIQGNIKKLKNDYKFDKKKWIYRSLKQD